MELDSITIDQMIKCIHRELRMRHRVYGQMVKNGTMNSINADAEINTMQQVKNVLVAVKYADMEALRRFKSEKGQTSLFELEGE